MITNEEIPFTNFTLINYGKIAADLEANIKLFSKIVNCITIDLDKYVLADYKRDYERLITYDTVVEVIKLMKQYLRSIKVGSEDYIANFFNYYSVEQYICYDRVKRTVLKKLTTIPTYPIEK